MVYEIFVHIFGMELCNMGPIQPVTGMILCRRCMDCVVLVCETGNNISLNRDDLELLFLHEILVYN